MLQLLEESFYKGICDSDHFRPTVRRCFIVPAAGVYNPPQFLEFVAAAPVANKVASWAIHELHDEYRLASSFVYPFFNDLEATESLHVIFQESLHCDLTLETTSIFGLVKEQYQWK